MWSTPGDQFGTIAVFIFINNEVNSNKELKKLYLPDCQINFWGQQSELPNILSNL